MKRLLLLLVSLPILATAQLSTKTVKKGFVIEGKLDGYADGTKISLYPNGTQTELTSAMLSKGKFTLKGDVAEPTLCFMIIGTEKPVELFVENKVISVKGNKAQPGKYDITGSTSHKEFQSFITTFLPMVQQMSSLATTINNTLPGAERDGLMKTYENSQQQVQAAIDKFVKEHTSSPVAAFILSATYQFNEDPVMLENRYNLLTEAVRTSTAGKQLQDFIAESKIGAIGTQAIDFTQPDTTGTPISLSSFRGKYVLVDFWASWCGPCRQENPNVVENYQNFSAKNFTVLGVSLDRPGQKAKWVEAIRADGLTWAQVSDLQFWNNAAAQLYKIQSIPQNILVDPNGKIIAKNLRGPALRDKLCQLFGCN